jgi:hypothetical protein
MLGQRRPEKDVYLYFCQWARKGPVNIRVVLIPRAGWLMRKMPPCTKPLSSYNSVVEEKKRRQVNPKNELNACFGDRRAVVC